MEISSSYFFSNVLGVVAEAAGCLPPALHTYSLFYLVNGTLTWGILTRSPTFLFPLLSGMLEDCIFLLEVRHSCMAVEPIKSEQKWNKTLPSGNLQRWCSSLQSFLPLLRGVQSQELISTWRWCKHGAAWKTEQAPGGTPHGELPGAPQICVSEKYISVKPLRFGSLHHNRI